MDELTVQVVEHVVEAEFVDETFACYETSRIAGLVKRIRTRQLYSFIEEVASRYGCTVEMICSRDRHSSVAAARHAVCYALRYDLPDSELSYPEIGRLIDRDHSTVMSSIRVYASKKTHRLLKHPPLLARTKPKPLLLQCADETPEIPDLELPQSSQSAVA